jgi:hypothetical protein
LAPTIGIAATGFCHPDGININYRLHHQDLQCFAIKNRQFRPKRQIAGQLEKIDLPTISSNLIRRTKFQATVE